MLRGLADFIAQSLFPVSDDGVSNLGDRVFDPHGGLGAIGVIGFAEGLHPSLLLKVVYLGKFLFGPALIGGPRAKARLAFGHPPIGRLSSFALTHLTGSAHAPPIKCVRADCDSRHEKKIKNHFLPMPAILAAQQPADRRQMFCPRTD